MKFLNKKNGATLSHCKYSDQPTLDPPLTAKKVEGMVSGLCALDNDITDVLADG